MMSPWEAYRWFQPSKTFISAPPMSGAAVICPANVNRVTLILGSTSTQGVVVGPDQSVTIATGLFLGSGLPIILSQKEHGSLCQSAWYVAAGGTSAAIAIEVALRDWPREDTWSTDKLINAISALIRALQGGSYAPPAPAPQPAAPPVVPDNWGKRLPTNWPQPGP